jgi:hypothetical protein
VNNEEKKMKQRKSEIGGKECERDLEGVEGRSDRD